MIVKVISKHDNVTLVEWVENGELQRSLLPSEEVSNDGECSNPQRGLSYGLPFADFISIDVTPMDIQRALYNSGIWTIEDVKNNLNGVQGAINSAFGLVLQNFLRNIRQEK